ncbi:MAG: ubiquinone biosynthesis hydroxylase [Methylobacterium mesophilicum]|nr:ubiquinone biosynthesis hydroxylase [Methylobacterium mesophilicum]
MARRAKKIEAAAEAPVSALPSQVDILVAGGNYVGMATALSLAQARPNLAVVVVDQAPKGAHARDGRASAIAAAACRMLKSLGVWDAIAPEAQPITEMIVTDSRRTDPIRPVFLTFDGAVGPGEPFAHMVPNGPMNGALRARAEEAGVRFIDGVGVDSFSTGEAGVSVRLADGHAVQARLLVAADGVKSRLRDQAGIRTVRWDYGQSGIVCTVRHSRPHEGRAEEHFLPAGPFAILPLKEDEKGHRSSIVWTEKTNEADRLVAADELLFEVELEERFGLKLGEIRVEGKARAWPLSLTLARDFVKPRFALVGDAAHGIHPIAGQGLNLGFKDAAALAEVIVEADRRGQDIGALDVLETYQRWRRWDTFQLGATTDVLNRVFSNDFGPLRTLRDVGLGLVDRMPRVKEFFIGQAAGLAADAPRLLRGERI